MTYVYEFLAIMWMSAACAITVHSGAARATFAAGLSIAAATLAILHEHRKHAKMPKPPVYIDITMDELLEALAGEEPDDNARMSVSADPEGHEGHEVDVSPVPA